MSPPSEFPVPGHQLPPTDPDSADPHRAPSTPPPAALRPSSLKMESDRLTSSPMTEHGEGRGKRQGLNIPLLLCTGGGRAIEATVANLRVLQSSTQSLAMRLTIRNDKTMGFWNSIRPGEQDALHRVKRRQSEGAIMTTAEKLYADDPLVIQKRLRDEWN